LVVLSIVSITLPIAASAVPPCLIATTRVSSKFGVLGERFHIRKTYNRLFIEALWTLVAGYSVVKIIEPVLIEQKILGWRNHCYAALVEML
jgi:hypothetical protein